MHAYILSGPLNSSRVAVVPASQDQELTLRLREVSFSVFCLNAAFRSSFI